jgi:nucleolin
VIVQYSAANTRTPFENRPRRKPTRSLYIGNLAFDLTDRELNDLFKSVRNIVEVRVAVDRETGQPRGFAHADFIDTASAQAALEILASKAPHGRRLKIDFSQRVSRRFSEHGENAEKREGEADESKE